VRTVLLDEGLRRTDAPNGLVVVTERLPGVRSAAVGIWVRSASGHESRAVMGVSHLLEHMVFKGTERRTARDIASALEDRGGSLDAFTSRDHTAYQAHVLAADLPLALDVLSDLVRAPLLREEDLALERNVVIEEINGVLDTPDDLVHELFAETLFPDHPYGYSILGTPDSVGGLQASTLRRTHTRGYYPGNCVIACAGDVDHDAFLALLDGLGWFAGDVAPALHPVAPATAARGVTRTEGRKLSQVHVVLGTDTVTSRDDRRWGLALLTTALGGGMSSRLFQRVREELGLCYAIYAWHGTMRSSGTAGVYVGTQPATADRAVEAIAAELGRLAAEGLGAAELENTKGQLRGQVLLGMEGTVHRMSRLVGHVLNDEPYRPIDEVLRRLDEVTPEETAELAATFLSQERMTTVRLGPTSR
jgi:predicted Zn-dependent peptidase